MKNGVIADRIRRARMQNTKNQAFTNTAIFEPYASKGTVGSK